MAALIRVISMYFWRYGIIDRFGLVKFSLWSISSWIEQQTLTLEQRADLKLRLSFENIIYEIWNSLNIRLIDLFF